MMEKKYLALAVAGLLAIANESYGQCGPGGCGAGRARSMGMSSKYNGGRSMGMRTASAGYNGGRAMANNSRMIIVQPPSAIQVQPPTVFVEPQRRVVRVQQAPLFVEQPQVFVQQPRVVFAPVPVGNQTTIRRGPFGRIREINTTGSVEFAGPRRAVIR